MIIIGITGTLGAGKGTVVEYLQKKGFVHYSAREFISEEIKKRGLPVNRDSMVSVGNDLRTTHSPSYIIEQLYTQAEQKGVNSVIESIRTPGEVMALRGKDNFTLLAVDADVKTRYERIRQRGSETDAIDFDTFVANEKREMSTDNPANQNLGQCIAMADQLQVFNNGSFDEFYQQIDSVLKKIGFNGR